MAVRDRRLSTSFQDGTIVGCANGKVQVKVDGADAPTEWNMNEADEVQPLYSTTTKVIQGRNAPSACPLAPTYQGLWSVGFTGLSHDILLAGGGARMDLRLSVGP